MKNSPRLFLLIMMLIFIFNSSLANKPVKNDEEINKKKVVSKNKSNKHFSDHFLLETTEQDLENMFSKTNPLPQSE